MSNNYNDELLEKASESLHIASQYYENDLIGTTEGKVLDELCAQVIKHIDENNLDDLYAFSLPALDGKLRQLVISLAEQGLSEMYGMGAL